MSKLQSPQFSKEVIKELVTYLWLCVVLTTDSLTTFHAFILLCIKLGIKLYIVMS